MKPPQISTLASVSPSRFVALQKCILKEAFAASRAKELLPKSPKAVLGTACHKLLELAAKKLVPANREHIAKEFDGLVSEAEKKLNNSPLDRHLIPLSKSCNEYFVIRQRTIKLALVLAERFAGYASKEGIPGLGHEVDVRTPDGLLKGRIDCVEDSEGTLTIKDYKTGTVFEGEAESVTIKPEYVTQLKLYAAMYAEVYFKWPDKLMLMPMSGQLVEVEMTRDECQTLAHAAREALIAANEKIRPAITDENPSLALASPSPDYCRFCSYRPVCPAYRNARDLRQDESWPNDLWGELREISISPIGRMTVLIKSGDAEPRTHVLRRLAHDGRYPGLQDAAAGTHVAFFSLRKENAPDTFTEGPMTTFYVV
jgi:RecB family exonuclease